MKKVAATLTNGTAPQFALGRPVCAAPCVLLAGHNGKCIASNGRQWVKR